MKGEIGRQSDFLAGVESSIGTLKRPRLRSWQRFQRQYLLSIEKGENAVTLAEPGCVQCGGTNRERKKHPSMKNPPVKMKV